MATKVASLYGELTLKDDRFKQGLTDAKTGMGGVKESLVSMAGQFLTAGAIIGGFKTALDFVITSASEAETESVRLEAILDATGNTVGMTSDQLFDLATNLSDLTGVEDETVIGAESLLLTFKEIGEDIFPRVLEGALDISATFKMDLSSAATMLGKAMEDPILGMTTLRRTGIFLSDQQQQQVKDFMAVNDVAGAQGIILGVVEGKLGGVAEKMGNTFQGNISKLKTEFGNFAEMIGGPVVSGVGAALGGFNGLLQTLIKLNDRDWKIPEIRETTYQYDAFGIVIGYATKSWSEYGDILGVTIPEEKSMQSTLWDSVLAMKDHTTASEGVVSAAELAAQRLEHLNTAAENLVDNGLSDLATVIGGALGDEIDNFNDRQADVRDRMGEVQTKIDELNGMEYLTSEQQTELDGLKQDQVDLQTEFANNATAHEEATNRILFGIAQQQLAMSGLDPSVQLGVLKELADRFGIVDIATQQANVAYETLTSATNAGNAKNLAEAMDYIRGAADDGEISVLDLNTALDILNGKQVFTKIYVDTYHQDFYTEAAQTPSNLPGQRNEPIMNAGGIDTWFSQPTWLLVGEAGLEHVKATPAGGTDSKGGEGNTFITVYGGNDPLAVYEMVTQAMDAKMRANERAGIQYSDY